MNREDADGAPEQEFKKEYLGPEFSFLRYTKLKTELIPLS